MPTPSPKLGLALPTQPDDFKTSDLRDNWQKIDAAPGAFICTSTTRPSWGDNQIGREIIETNTRVRRMWTGTGWFATTPEPGDFKATASASVPDGWLPCDGRVLNRSTYSHLFAAIGTSHNTGGEAATEFRIPNIIGRTIIGRDPVSGNTYGALGARFGSSGTTLTANNLPPHTHTMNHQHASGTTGTESTNHSHSVTISGGGHEHLYARNGGEVTEGYGTGGFTLTRTYMLNAITASTIGGGAHSHSVTVGNQDTLHTHNVTIPAFNGNTGAGPGTAEPVSVMQPSIVENVYIRF